MGIEWGFQVRDWTDPKGNVWPLIEAKAGSLSEAFGLAAQGFFTLITRPETVRPEVEVEIFCESADLDLLFSDWINTLIYETREKRMLFSRFEIEVEGINVKGKIYGERFDPERHPLLRDSIQGIAFNELLTYEGPEEVIVRGVMDDTPRHLVSFADWRKK